MSQVRVRFAPSPTGFFHIGSARTALFNWLYARHTGGRFVLRIEDTDKARSTEEFLDVIYDSLSWLGLDWDEGPNVGGDFGPYKQSERGEIYREYLEKLKNADRTYEKDGAVYFRISGEPQVIEDAIRGRVERTEEKDFVIVRSDGSPVFHVVNVIDDLTMGITHVIRGEDHLSNTSKHTELFKALGAPLPTFAHIPLILKQHGPGKMSKRDQGAHVGDYQKRGVLPEALINFLCLLGWSPKDDREKLSLDEVVSLFDFPGINQSNARFDDKKLANMNMAYLLDMPEDAFIEKAVAYLDSKNTFSGGRPDDRYLREVLRISHPKIRGVEELPDYISYFLTEEFPIDDQARVKVMKKGDPLARLRELAEALPNLDFSSEAALDAGIRALGEEKGFGFGQYQAVARLATTGRNVGPSLTAMFQVMGKDRVQTRIKRFLQNQAE